MGIRLLSKSDIDKAKALDREREISEGLKLSRKVDALRELKSREESELESYRRASLAAMQREIGILDKELAKLGREKKQLQDEISLLLPGMATKREELDKREKSIKELEKEIKKRSEEVDFAEIDIAIAQKNASDALVEANSRTKESRKLHKDADEDRNEAREALEHARTVESNTLALEKAKEENFLLQGNALSLREKGIAEQEEHNKQVSQDLEVERKQLADQRATLERALDRIRKNRI